MSSAASNASAKSAIAARPISDISRSDSNILKRQKIAEKPLFLPRFLVEKPGLSAPPFSGPRRRLFLTRRGRQPRHLWPARGRHRPEAQIDPSLAKTPFCASTSYFQSYIRTQPKLAIVSIITPATMQLFSKTKFRSRKFSQGGRSPHHWRGWQKDKKYEHYVLLFLPAVRSRRLGSASSGRPATTANSNRFGGLKMYVKKRIRRYNSPMSRMRPL